MAKRKSKALNNAVEVDIVSDFVCPWCWLGYKLFLKGAEQARKQLKTQINLSWRPYMLSKRSRNGRGLQRLYGKKIWRRA